MKQVVLAFSLSILLVQSLMAQLPDGSEAPNWTMSDLDGVPHTLYDYLDDGKVVFLDFSATWCGPCWSYHNSGAFETLYEEHGPDGTNDIMAFMIETDVNTNTACLYGPSGCVGGTQGNWVAGTPYPIIDDASQFGPYAISFYPTIYGVCPDKTITQVGQAGYNTLWNFAQNCPLSVPNVEAFTMDVDCFGNSSGAIDLLVTGGVGPFTYTWSNGANTEDLADIPAGNYAVLITGSNGGTVELENLMVNQPATPLTGTESYSYPTGCNGIGGEAMVMASGGSPSYSYVWNNGMTGNVAFNLQEGVYQATVTDNNACTHTIENIIVEPALIPVSSIAPAPSLNCDAEEVVLDGSNSTSGTGLIYTWSTVDGNIVSGNGTMNINVDEAGTYDLTVTYSATTCSAVASEVVEEDVAEPTADAGDAVELDCENTSTSLSGTASTGSEFEYLWTTVGGNIVSGATTLEPVVDEEGDYILTVSNLNNGCTASSETEALGNTTPPDASATDGELTCIVSDATLEGNSTAPDVSYEWSGPNNFSSEEQDVTVSTPGEYILTVTDEETGCTASVLAEVTEDATPPNASASGDEITCDSPEVAVEGSSTTPDVTYEWNGPDNFASSEQSPEVDLAGNYNLTVTAPNGCTETAVAIVSENTTAPTASAGSDDVLNCNETSLVLNGAGSSNGNQFTYEWTTTGGNIVSGETTTTPTIDEPGTYQIMVTNENTGCTNMASAVVTETPPLLSEIGSQNNVACFGGNDGAAEVSASGGDGDYTYAWSNGPTTAAVSELSVGTYTVVVTDGEDCSVTETVEITQPIELTLSTSATAQTAPGMDDGSANADATGGSGGLTYLWSNGETTASIFGLAPGNYTVEVSDINGCIETQTVTVNVFGCAVSASTSANDVSCHGSTDGSASISLNNAASPITYLWSNDETTAEIDELAPGTYSITASDGNSCEVVTSVEVGEPVELNPNATSTAVTSAGADDGTASANPTGGTSPFTYLWDNGETTPTIFNLPSANYTVEVTDANGCVSEQTVPVAPANCAMLATITSNNVSCFASNDGQATVTLNNGLSPFTYLWSNDETTATISDLEPGLYTVEVMDAVGCSVITEVTLTEPSMLEASVVSVSNADCGVSNGAATVEAEGGTQGYEFIWSNGLMGASQTDLEAGSYTVEVTDQNDCATSAAIEISVDDTEAPTVATQNISVEIGAAGSIEITPNQIDNGSTDNCDIANMELDMSSFDCTALGEQTVTLTVTDGAGNSSNETAIVTVMDATAPDIEVQDITISLDENGEAVVPASMIDNGSTDNCQIMTYSSNISEFNCADLGANAVELTVADNAGNSSSGTAIVTIVDDLAPTVECPDNKVLAYCDPVAEYEVTADDNCPDNLSYQWTQPSGSSFPTGVTEVEVIVTDQSGNASACNFTVTVPEAMEIGMEQEGISCVGAADGSLTANVNGGAPGYSYLWSTGETMPTITGLGAGEYSLVVTDDTGCEETLSLVLEEPTAVDVTVVNLQNEMNMQSDGAVEIDVAGGTPGYSFEWTNEAGDVVSTDEDLIDVPAGTYTLVIVDDNGCSSLHVYTIQSVVSTIDQILAAKINLFPNPTSGLVMLTFEDVNATEAVIMAYSVTGQIVAQDFSAGISSGAYELDFSAQPGGVYFVKILVGERLVTKRVVVSK